MRPVVDLSIILQLLEIESSLDASNLSDYPGWSEN